MYSKNLVIFGGGRWARVIVSVLDELLSECSSIQMYSPNNSKGLTEWVTKSGINRQIDVFCEPPNIDKIKKNSVAIIVNSADKHFSSAVFSLSCMMPTLIEKPFSMTASDVCFLTNLSKVMQTPVYSSHVFLFARYITDFVKSVKQLGEIEEINVSWSDPAVEVRYGEQKQYDNKITVMHDVMPHIVSIIRMFTNKKIQYDNIEVERGGAQVKLTLNIGNAESKVNISRNADVRQRLIEIKTKTDNAMLDFTREPGEITIKNEKTNADPGWIKAPKPLYLMLKSFLEESDDSNLYDERLSPVIALEACEIIDAAFKDYRNKLIEWLQSTEIPKINKDNEYMLTELIGTTQSNN